MMTIHNWKWVFAIVLVYGLSGLHAFGQAASQTAVSPASHQRVSLPMLYHFFLAYQNHLDRVAAKLDEKGMDGSEFRNHFQQRLGLSDAEFGAVRATAQRLETELNELDSEAKAIIDATRAQAPRIIHGPEDVPPVPPELIRLQSERNSIIEREVADLKATLGPEKASQLDALIQNQFAPNVTVKMVHPPLMRGSAGHGTPPLAQGVR